MATPSTTEIITSLVYGLLTGGASAVTTIMASFKSVKTQLAGLETRMAIAETKISTIESKVGASDKKGSLDEELGEIKEHLFIVDKSLQNLSDEAKIGIKLRKEIEGWEYELPLWAKKLSRTSHANIGDTVSSIEDNEKEITALKAKYKALSFKLKEIEDRTFLPVVDSEPVSRKEYDSDRKLTDEKIEILIRKIESIDGIIRGIFNLIDRK